VSAPPAAPRHLLKRSFRLAGHRTSVALESEFWGALEDAAGRRGQTLADMHTVAFACLMLKRAADLAVVHNTL
jgi:predicted DNA-binding ribbon-helix-helix protein